MNSTKYSKVIPMLLLDDNAFNLFYLEDNNEEDEEEEKLGICKFLEIR